MDAIYQGEKENIYGPSVCLEIFTKEKCVMTKAISIT